MPSRVGRYEIVDRLGAGGMGEVYLATDPLLSRTVAIKVLTRADDEFRDRFGREARAQASLQHQNIATVYDVGEDNGRPFIAMEFIDGESVSEIIERKPALSVARRLRMMSELCAGLGHAHRSHIIHRDIKPGNLMIAMDGGTLKILDFGLARPTATSSRTALTLAGAVMGTPHYMSPEQIEGKAIDHRSDIFSVGLVLYELLSYQKAFAGDTTHAVINSILYQSPTPIRSLLPAIDAELEEIVRKGIERELGQRYQSLVSLAADLDRVRARLVEDADEPVFVRHGRGRTATSPPSTNRRSPRTSGRLRSLDAVAQRRAEQVEMHVTAAAKHFAEGAFEAAIQECENAVVFDPQEARALDLLDRAHSALDERQAGQWLEEADSRLSNGELTVAEVLLDQSLRLRPDSLEAQRLQRRAGELRREREAAPLSVTQVAPVRTNSWQDQVTQQLKVADRQQPARAASPRRFVLLGVAGAVLALGVWAIVSLPQTAPAQTAPTERAATERAPVPSPSPQATPQIVAAPATPSTPDESETRASTDRREAETARNTETTLAEALRLHDSGDFNRAILLYNTILSEDPENPAATRGLGMATRAQKERAEQVAGHLAEAQERLAEGEYDAAILAYEAALRIDPREARAITGLTNTRKAKAAETAALEALRKRPGPEVF